MSVSFQYPQVLSIQLRPAPQFAYFRVLVDFWDSEVDDPRQVKGEIDGQLRKVSENSRRTINHEIYRDNDN